MAKKYDIFVNDRIYAAQVGERYEWDIEDTEASLVATVDSLDGAISILDDEIMNLNGYYRVIKTKHGLDSVEYGVVSVWSYDDEDDWCESELVEAERSLPDHVEQLMKQAEKGYWSWLDYEEDGYDNVSAMLRED